MIYAIVLSCLFISCQITGSLHYHDRGMITSVVSTDRAFFRICQCVTGLAVTDIFSGIQNGVCQSFYPLCRHVQDVKCQTLRGLAADARQRRQFFNQFTDLLAVVIH